MFSEACHTFEEFVITARDGRPVTDELKAKALKFAEGARKIKANRAL